MALFADYFVQQVLTATDIVDLIGRYLALQKKGREFVGLCPFHADNKPSMYVNPVKQIFKCFSCGAGGDAFGFLMKYEKMSFPEAVKMLAEQANIPVPDDADRPAPQPGMSKNDLASLVERAQSIYVKQLGSDAGKGAKAYALGRGLTEESLVTYGIGYAPDRWDTIADGATRQGIPAERVIAAGLCKQSDNGRLYDYFRERLMFPIHDQTGRVVAFGGRAMSEEERAKYLNSPESALFDKSSLVYGLHFSREEIVKRKQAIVVEGYLDVLIPHQAGVTNIVATLGTSLTDRHVRLLSRYAEEVVLLFDADEAGAKAAERALELFLAQKINVRVATIPEGKDPADYVLSHGGEALRTLIDNAPDALEYLWQKRSAQLSGANPAQRQQIVDSFLTTVVSSGMYGAIDETRRSSLAQHIAHMINVSSVDLHLRMKELGRKIRKPAQRDALPAGNMAATQGGLLGTSGNPERLILEVLLNEPDLFDDVVEKIDPTDFADVALRAIAEYIWTQGIAGKLYPEMMLADESLVSLSEMITSLMYAGSQRGNFNETLADATAKILDRKNRAEHEQAKREAVADGSDESLHALQNRLRERSGSMSDTDKGKRDLLRRPNIQ